MKILFLNPHIDAQHPVAQGLERRGVAVLYPANTAEAYQMLQLHGSSVDLAIIHREVLPTYDPAGLALIHKIKQDPSQADLPFILSTERWSDAECAQHQKTPDGANAYLRYPFTESQALAMIEAVTGQKVGTSATQTQSSASIGDAPGIVMPARAPDAPVIPENESSVGIELSHEEAGSGSASIPTAASGSIPPMKEEVRIPTATFTRQGVGVPIEGQASPPPAPEQSEMAGVVELSEPPSARIEDTGSIVLEAPPLPPGAFLPSDNHAAQSVNLQAENEAPSSIEISVIGVGQEPAATAPASEQVFELADGPAAHGSVEPEIVSSAQAVAVELPPEPAITAQQPSVSPGEDDALAQELPYLFPRSTSGVQASAPASGGSAFIQPYAQPVGDAVVPGGAAHTPDLETLKKYLLLREQDVAALSSQLRAAREQLDRVQDTLRIEKARGAELSHEVEEQRRRIHDFDREKSTALEGVQSEMAELRFQMKAKVDKARLLETHVKDAAEEMERLKERVRTDIRKIRVREKELESKLEIMKKDAEALIVARENKIVELKRKLDLMEFNMDLLQDRYTREKDASTRLRERLTKAAQAVRVAGGVLDPSVTGETQEGEAAPSAAGSDRRAAS